jgi:predicted dehydrogenase
MSPELLTGAPEIARVLIVGCGNIAGGFDSGRSVADWPYSHAGAYRRDGRFRMVACVEPDDTRRHAFMAQWDIPLGYRSIDETAGGQFDVISICSPSGCHAHDLEVALALRPKIIFCEKPVTTSLAQTERLVRACGDAGVMIAVNYSRRFDQQIVSLQARLAQGEWGKLRSVTGTYNKGILNNGSHMLDLLSLLLGELNIVAVGKPVFDYFPDDPAVPVWLESASGVPVQLACGHAGDYSVFELQFVFAQGILAMEDGGLFWRTRRAEDSSVFVGYRVLDAGARSAGGYPQAMQNAVSNVYESIYLGGRLASSGDTALATQRICETIRRRACV